CLLSYRQSEVFWEKGLLKLIIMEPIIIKSSAIAISPQKMNVVAGIIRKKKLDYSLKVLEFLPKKGGRILYKLLAGAAKSLEKSQEQPANFYLQKVEVNQGKIQKRVIYRAKGRTNRIRKRYSLINLHLSKKEVITNSKNSKINNKEQR